MNFPYGITSELVSDDALTTVNSNKPHALIVITLKAVPRVCT